MSAAPPPDQENTATPPQSRIPEGIRKLFRGRFLFFSIAIHVVFALVATYLVVSQFTARPKPTFKAMASGPKAPKSTEHKISMTKRKNTMSAPPQAKRITTTAASKVALPEMPSISMSDDFTPGQMSGMGGAGGALAMGGGSMGGGGGAAGLTMFGARIGKDGLVGTLYDFKRNSSGRPVTINKDPGTLRNIASRFADTWRPPGSFPHFDSKAKLVAKAFFFPAIQDSEAGKAFQDPETGPGMWIAHYQGNVTCPVTGTYRFVGWGDNLMAVGVDRRVVIDASDAASILPKRDRPIGAVNFPGKNGTPMHAGKWMNLKAGDKMRIDVLLGDAGGIYCAGLMLQKKDDPLTPGKGGVPTLPLFLVGPLNASEKELYSKWLTPQSLDAPVFKVTQEVR